MITRGAPPMPWQVSVDVTGGSQGRSDLSSSLGGTTGVGRYLVNGGRRSTEWAPGRGDTRGALAERWDGLAKLGWSVGGSVEVEAQGVVVDERQRWRAGQLYTFSDNRQFGGRVGAVWSRGDRRVAPTLYWSEFDHLSRRSTTAEPLAGTGERDVQRLAEAELLYNDVAGPVAVDLGVEARRESTVSDRVLGGERTLHGVEPFAQATWKAGRVDLVPGARLSWSEQWGTHFTPRLAAMFRPVPALAVRASAGRGLRAPAFKELYLDFLNLGDGFGYAVRGNPELRPETSTNVSVGLEWAAGATYLRGQLFHNRFADFIETGLVEEAPGLTVYSYANVANGRTAGFEVEGGVAFGSVRAEAGYGFLEATAGDTGERLLGRAAHSGRASLETRLGVGPRVAVTGVFTGRAPVQRTDAGVVDRDGFLRFDLRLTQDLPGNLQLSAGAQNLLDARPELWPGFAGRHLYLGIGWTASGSPRP